MKTKETRVLSLALILSLVLGILSGCGGDKSPGTGGKPAVLTEAAAPAAPEEGEGVSYSVETLLDAEAQSLLFYRVAYSDGGFYLVLEENMGQGVFEQSLAFMDLEGNITDLHSDWLRGGAVGAMFPCPEGGVWLNWAPAPASGDDPYEYRLGRVTREGLEPGPVLPEGMRVGDICTAGSRLFADLFNANGGKQLTAYSNGEDEYTVESSHFDMASDGQSVYMLGRKDGNKGEKVIVLYSFDPDSREKTELFTFTQGDLLGCDGDKTYIKDSTSLYCYDRSTGNVQQLLRWASCGISVSNQCDIYPDGSGGLYLCDGVSGIWQLVPNAGGGAKRQVVLAINDPYWMDKEQVMQFNRESADYEVIIKDYSGYPDPQTTLNTEILAGNGPDILDIMSFSGEMLNPNAMTDIASLIESDPDLSMDDFLERPIELMMTEDGRLPGIAPRFIIRTFMCRADIAQAQEFKGIADALERLGPAEGNFSGDVSGNDFLRLAFAYGGAEEYSQEDITAILEYAKGLPAETPSENEQIYWDIVSGNVTMLNEGIYDTLAIPDMMSQFFHCRSLEEITVWGLPFRSGSGALEPMVYYAIPAGAKCPEGAWAYLKSALALEGEKMPYYISAFPLMKEIYVETCDFVEGNLREGMELGYWDESQNIYFDFFDTGVIDFSDRLIDEMNGIYTNDQALYKIVADSAAPFFNGEKSAQETAKEIMSRMEIYFAERK